METLVSHEQHIFVQTPWKKRHFVLPPPKKTMVANVFQLISYMGLPIGRRSFNGVWGTTQKINPPWYCPIQIPFKAYCASLNPIVRRSMTSISCQGWIGGKNEIKTRSETCRKNAITKDAQSLRSQNTFTLRRRKAGAHDLNKKEVVHFTKTLTPSQKTIFHKHHSPLVMYIAWTCLFPKKNRPHLEFTKVIAYVRDSNCQSINTEHIFSQHAIPQGRRSFKTINLKLNKPETYVPRKAAARQTLIWGDFFPHETT